MKIYPQNILYVYNSSDDDSLKLAQEYSFIRQVPGSNLLGLDTFTKSVFSNRKEFEEELMAPIKNSINLMGGLGNIIKACVLGYRIPSGYYSEFGTISSCSAISCMFLNAETPINNPSYRRESKEADLNNFNIMPTCQHDMPTFSVMKRKISEFASFKNGINADGSFYFDRWSLKEDYDYTVYSIELEEFETKLIKNYFKKYLITSEPVDNLRSDFGFANNDSFFWSAGLQNLTQSYFRNTNKANRIFFFNADNDSFMSFRQDNQFGPAIAALYSGYQSAAGMMSDFSFQSNQDPYNNDPYKITNSDETSCWLRPESFFKSLTLDFGILESMYFASPLLCCPLTYFADPCMKVDLKDSLSIPDKMSAQDGWQELHLKLSEMGALIENRMKAASSLLSRVGTYKDVSDAVWATKNYSYVQTGNSPLTLKSFAQPAISGWKKFIEVAYFDKLSMLVPNFTRFVNEIDFKLTKGFIGINLNNSQISEEISSENIEPNGFFYIDTFLPEENIGTGYYQIKADIYENLDDEKPVLTSISYNDRNNWLVEDFNKKMNPFPPQGMFSSLKDRKIRFTNRTKLANKILGNKIWVKFTFFFDTGQSITNEIKEALIIS